MMYGKSTVSPCVSCRLYDGGECDRKDCRRWQVWFLRRWARIHGYWQKYGKEWGHELEK